MDVSKGKTHDLASAVEWLQARGIKVEKRVDHFCTYLPSYRGGEEPHVTAQCGHDVDIEVYTPYGLFPRFDFTEAAELVAAAYDGYDPGSDLMEDRFAEAAAGYDRNALQEKMREWRIAFKKHWG